MLNQYLSAETGKFNQDLVLENLTVPYRQAVELSELRARVASAEADRDKQVQRLETAAARREGQHEQQLQQLQQQTRRLTQQHQQQVDYRSSLPDSYPILPSLSIHQPPSKEYVAHTATLTLGRLSHHCK